MSFRHALVLISLICLLLTAAVSAQEPIELRLACFEDRNECAVYADMLSRFSADNPAIQVAVDVMRQDEIASAILDGGVDIARISNVNALSGKLLDLRPLIGNPNAPDGALRSLYFEALRGGEAGDAVHGYPDSLGMVAPFVNTSAFDAADVALPGADATWDDWLAALESVADATGIAYALAVDNKDHRYAGAAISLGANYFDENGDLTLPDDSGLRGFVEMMSGLRDAGKTPSDTALGTGKSEAYFVAGEALMYICGSWKAEAVASQVGDAFEWAIVPSPVGPGGSSAIAKATFMVALADTEHPQAVARVFDFLAPHAGVAEFASRALIAPARESVAAADIAYETDDPVVSAALNAFARQVTSTSDQALSLDLHPMSAQYYAASNTWLRGYFAGDWQLDEALAGIRAQLQNAALTGSG